VNLISSSHKNTIMKKKLLFLSILGLFGTTVVFGQPPPVKQRQMIQQKRIINGAVDGKITKGEFVSLQRQQRAIKRAKIRANCDRKVTRWERARIHRAQNAANRNIYRKKHNRLDRF
jgi:hypothetical protein